MHAFDTALHAFDTAFDTASETMHVVGDGCISDAFQNAVTFQSACVLDASCHDMHHLMTSIHYRILHLTHHAIHQPSHTPCHTPTISTNTHLFVTQTSPLARALSLTHTQTHSHIRTHTLTLTYRRKVHVRAHSFV